VKTCQFMFFFLSLHSRSALNSQIVGDEEKHQSYKVLDSIFWRFFGKNLVLNFLHIKVASSLQLLLKVLCLSSKLVHTKKKTI
jgi:hypothetical protein